MARSLPMWTHARLVRVMKLRFGETRRGGVDTTGAAEAMGVSRRTVQRWLHASSGRSVARLPRLRREALIAALRPSEQRLRHEADQARYAAKAIVGLTGRPDDALPGWREKRWLEPHLVVILDVPVTATSRVRQVASVRDDSDRIKAMRKRGRVVASVVVPTNFHATLVIHAVLQRIDPWRYQAQPRQAKQGWTATWTADAPSVPLAEVWGRIEADLPALDVPTSDGSTPST